MDRVFNLFEEILKIPRSSGNEGKIANYLVEFANKHNLEYTRDEFNNVFIKKDNHSNNTIILQAHSDMVCVSNMNYDFDNNGIDYYIDGDYYKGRN
jgi:dipeptidase D